MGPTLMRLLLDTHVLLWWWTDDRRLSPRASAAITNLSNEVHVSAASAWEIATKTRLGKLREAPDAVERFSELTMQHGFTHLPVSHHHGLRAGGYDWDHRDPFDRMLAAQSEIEGLRLVSRDHAFAEIGVKTIW